MMVEVVIYDNSKYYDNGGDGGMTAVFFRI